MKAPEILELKIIQGDHEGTTIRAYLHALLSALLEECEVFSGKAPFGNSDWYFDLAATLVQNGVIEGTIEEYGEVDCDWAQYNAAFEKCLNYLFLPPIKTDTKIHIP